MSSLSLPRSASDWRSLAHKALAWWLAELAALMPDAVRRLAVAKRGDDLVLRFGKEEVTLTVSGRTESERSVIPLGPGTGTTTLWVKQRFPGSGVRILLADDVLFRCAVELPTAAEASMTQILRHQLERLVPLDPGTLSFVWHVAERIPHRNALTVAMTIVRNVTLDQARACAHDLALSPIAILITQGNGAISSVWRGEAHQGSRRRRLYRGLEAAALALCLIAYVVDIARLDHRRSVLRERLGPAQTRIQAVARASAQLAVAKAALATIQTRLAAPTPLAVLNELTQRLPLDASLSEFTFKPDRVDVTGTASHATALLGVLAQSRMFDDTQFAAPITAAPDGLREHFELSFQLRQQKP